MLEILFINKIDETILIHYNFSTQNISEFYCHISDLDCDLPITGITIFGRPHIILLTDIFDGSVN
jgi:hypothetical protein